MACTNAMTTPKLEHQMDTLQDYYMVARHVPMPARPSNSKSPTIDRNSRPHALRLPWNANSIRYQKAIRQDGLLVPCARSFGCGERYQLTQRR